MKHEKNLDQEEKDFNLVLDVAMIAMVAILVLIFTYHEDAPPPSPPSNTTQSQEK